METPDEYKKIISQCSIVFLSKPGCKWCSELESYLVTRNVDFIKLDVNEYEYGIELVEYIKNQYEVTSFPICFRNGTYVGCKQELVDIIDENYFNDIENI